MEFQRNSNVLSNIAQKTINFNETSMLLLSDEEFSAIGLLIVKIENSHVTLNVESVAGFSASCRGFSVIFEFT